MKTILLNLSKKKQTLSFRFSVNTASLLLHWYQSHKRDLPWRNSTDPYQIWVSEIIMQQTRINQGLPYFNRFITLFPTVFALANAPIDSILLAWQGLGYYSRARNMHETAKFVVAKLNGIFPKTAKELQKLKGIGSYTAAAIASICFNELKPAIDGNVIRVISRIYNINLSVDRSEGKKLIELYANELIKNQNPGDFNQALMDFGATICTPSQPLCNNCPAAIHCEALHAKTVAIRPIKEAKTKVRQRFFIYACFTDGQNILINKRNKNDIWKGLYELPAWEFSRKTSIQEFLDSEIFPKLIPSKKMILTDIFQAPLHKLSHQTIDANFILVQCEQVPEIENSTLINYDSFKNYAFPKLIESYLTKYLPQIKKIKNLGFH